MNSVLNAFVDDDGRHLLVYEKTSDGFRERRIRARYVTYHRKEEISSSLMRTLKSSTKVSNIFEDNSWIGVSWFNEQCRRQARWKFKDFNVETYEGDVDPVRWWLTEHKPIIARPRRCFLDIEADSRVSFANKEKMRILIWAVSDSNGPVASGVLSADTNEAERELLRELWKVLENYDQVCAWYGGDPEDAESGFDFYVIAKRTIMRGLPIDTRRWLWLDQLVVWRRMNSAESGDEKESMRLEDIAQNQLKEGKEPTPDWVVKKFGNKGLGALSWDLWSAGGKYRELLHQYCIKDTELLRKLEARKGFLTLFQTLCEVCSVFGTTKGLNPTAQMDGFLLRLGRERNYRFPTKRYEKEEKKKQFEGAFVLAPKSVPGNPKTDPQWTKAKAAEWRVTHNMTTGILTNVHVLDFASLYPSIIITWNLGVDSIVEDPDILGEMLATGKRPDGICRSPGTGVLTFTEPWSILAEALRTMLRLRKEWSDKAASLPPGTPEWQDAMAISTAYKVAANSFYGVVGAISARYFKKEVAESTTQNGVWLIKRTISEGDKRGIECIASDTDSSFVIGPSRDGFSKFVNWLNEILYPRIVAETGVKENHIKVAYEKAFDILIFTSKKKYIGKYNHFKWKTTCTRCVDKKGNPGSVDVRTLLCANCEHQYKTQPEFIGKPEIKGLEYKRGDQSLLTRRFQGQIIDLLVGGLKLNPGIKTPNHNPQVYRDLIQKWKIRIFDNELAIEEVRKSQGLNKPLKEYGKDKDGRKGTIGPHVQVARILQERGQHIAEKTRIEYVVVDGNSSPMKVIPAEDYTGECDRFYLWDTLVYPPVQRLLDGAFPNENWEQYANVRPKKRRGKKALEGQLALNLEPTVSSQLDTKELAMPTYSSKPLVIHVDEVVTKQNPKLILQINKILKSRPGARSVELHLNLESGQTAVLKTEFFVTTGEKLREDIEELIATVSACELSEAS